MPVGTADRVRATIAEELAARGVTIPFSVASNPEFLKEGAAVEDFMRPDRVVVGASDERAIAALRALYAPFMRNHERFLVMDVRSAELTKYAANAMLATRISFMNELANLADQLGADIEMVRQGIGSDPRIGYHFLYPGVGYGGSCFPEGREGAAVHRRRSSAIRSTLLAAVERVNEAQKHVLVDKIVARLGDDLVRPHVRAVGPRVQAQHRRHARGAVARDRSRRSPARGARVVAYDPIAMDEARRIFGDAPHVAFATSPLAACDGADALVVVTEWKEFRSPDFDELKPRLATPLVFDGRNLYSPAERARGGPRVLRHRPPQHDDASMTHASRTFATPPPARACSSSAT